MFRKILLLIGLSPFVAQLSGAAVGMATPVQPQNAPTAEYYDSSPVGIGCYKTEAIRQLVTPLMEEQAAAWSADPRVRELVTLSRAVDNLVFDGMRLVRIRGVLVDNGPIDDFTVYRTVFYFNVTPAEARAWLLASRLMQMSHFKDNGAALMVMEQDLSDTAVDLALRLKTYFGDNAVFILMPHFAEEWGWAPIGKGQSAFVGR